MIGVLRERFARRRRPPATGDGERIYAVGDIHGRLDLLRDLLKLLEQDVEDRPECFTRVVFLGDFIDRGRFSRGVISALRNIQTSTDQVTALLGNHEELLLNSAAGQWRAQQVWLHNGGDATLRSLGLDPDEVGSWKALKLGAAIRDAVGTDNLEWLASLPLSHRSGDYFFCHAGVRPGVKLSAQQRSDLLWIRDEFTDSDLFHGAVIVHGHSESDEPEDEHNRINVDTAAYRTGRLTAVGLEGSERWFVSTPAEA